MSEVLMMRRLERKRALRHAFELWLFGLAGEKWK